MPHSKSNKTGTQPTPSKSPARGQHAQNKPRGAASGGARSEIKSGSGDAVKGRTQARESGQRGNGTMGVGTGRGQGHKTPPNAPAEHRSKNRK